MRPEKYVKAIAIDWVCPNSGHPLTEWEFKQVKYLTHFGLAILRNYPPNNNFSADPESDAAITSDTVPGG